MGKFLKTVGLIKLKDSPPELKKNKRIKVETRSQLKNG
jgi:hypothetical protein